MGLLDKFRSKPVATPKTMVSFYDQSGRLVQIPREQWRNSILPATIRQYRSDPEQLSAVIAGAFQEGLFHEVIEAAQHLNTIDPVPVRSACLYAIALMKTGHLDEAEGVLRSFLKNHGENGTVLTNLAKVQAERRDHVAASATLWRALEVDPNTENAVTWYAALAHDGGGKSAQIEAWEKVAALPHSWRPQLQLARTALEARDLPKALALYREAIGRAPHPVPPELLLQMTGDLGLLGHVDQAVELGDPLYSVDAHGPRVGNNLMKAHFDVGNYDRARSILNQLRLRSQPESKQVVDFWQAQLTNR